ncbi:30S ribosomal protein S15 [Candidatus Berkelbacteria bacterium CG23_combo_of_CG06-09_8_20_14_all_41_73]|uniref:30S ribosomal protein S15 n=1 Tax=Candidatus Berkelbacteria bacterium CG23_combo_of_CG06-09_8_20_14_all_41_73 TaxID=1974519 RepID=A0A2H0AZM6_9BACT|nr:MAG: 30S ribosomal protein S15 [Candidatus Berkelbacteria bacterium CG23_combo_of_CG06-09_8_20_14_all_41_73]
MTKKIAELTKHLKEHKHDFDSRVGLLKMVGKRRRLLNYLKKSDEKKYGDLIADLKLRK